MFNHRSMNAQLTEIMRLITNLIRTGTVTEVDRENWLCRVKVGELETNWINWLTLRAGGARTWWCPSPDEQVVVLSMGGNLETAFALPALQKPRLQLQVTIPLSLPQLRLCRRL